MPGDFDRRPCADARHRGPLRSPPRRSEPAACGSSTNIRWPRRGAASQNGSPFDARRTARRRSEPNLARQAPQAPNERGLSRDGIGVVAEAAVLAERQADFGLTFDFDQRIARQQQVGEQNVAARNRPDSDRRCCGDLEGSADHGSARASTCLAHGIIKVENMQADYSPRTAAALCVSINS